MNFHIITIFPETLESYFNASILGRAKEKDLINIKFYNPRDYADKKDKRRIDDTPFGGGVGMVMKLEPIVKTIEFILTLNFKTKNLTANSHKLKVILFTPSAEQFTQTMARKWAKDDDDIIFICGRYEGIDARLKKVIKDIFSFYKLKTKIYELSIGPYVLTGGELPVAVVIDAISRHILGVLGRSESLEDEKGVGIPVYTRPEVFEYKPPFGEVIGKKYKTPKVLVSGNHKKIEEWKNDYKIKRSKV